jgi:hypothetical protein
MNSSLVFPIADPATFVPDRNEILTPGTVTSRMICLASTNFGEKIYAQLCFNVQDRRLPAALHQSWRHVH